MTNDDLQVTLPPGPALIYVHSDSGDGSVAYTRVDRHAPVVAGGFVGTDPRTFPTDRERAVLRALLTHALMVLDQAEGRTGLQAGQEG